MEVAPAASEAVGIKPEPPEEEDRQPDAKKIKIEQKPVACCDFCSSKWSSEVTLERHVRFEHELKGQFECDTCKEVFTFQSSLQMHISLEHHDSQDFQCAKCDSNFYAKRNLLNHIMKVHEKRKLGKLLKCDYCTMTCRDERGLRSHELESHNMICLAPTSTGFPCGERFQELSWLRIHCKVRLLLLRVQWA